MKASKSAEDTSLKKAPPGKKNEGLSFTYRHV